MLDALSDDAELIAPCGINCSVCSRYLARKYDLHREGLRIPYCEGCRPRDKKCAFQKRCDLLRENKVGFCYECSSFPCGNLEPLDARYQKHYHLSVIENLTFIKKHSLTVFMERENAKWRCMLCGAVRCCHNGICYNCSVNRLLTRKKLHRWDDEQ
ncbi:MAG: DUF3795 domain-containing protein [Halobacteriota archaeon]